MTDLHTHNPARTSARKLPCALLYLGVLLMGLSTSCGGGSAGDPDTNRTITIFPNAPAGNGMDGDGWCSYRTLDRVDDNFFAGDGEDDPSGGTLPGDFPYYGVLYFPLSEIPSGATVVGARLYLTTLDSTANLFVSLGRLRFVRIPASTPMEQGAIVAAPELTHDPATDLPDAPASNQEFGTGQLENLRAARADGEDLFLRIEFESATDNDRSYDYIAFASSRHATAQGPRLEIVIEE